MKKRLLKYSFIILLIAIVINTKDVFAASAGISANRTSAYTNESVTINVSCNAAAWNLQVGGSINDYIVGYDNNGNNTNCSQSYSLNTSSPGTYTVTLSGDITDQDETNMPINQSVSVTITQKPEPTPAPTPQPTPTPTPTPSNNNTNNNTPSTNNTTPTETPKEELKEDKKEEDKNQIQKEKITIKKFEIVGYDLDFNQDKKKYTLDILEDLKELYIIIEGEDIEVSPKGKVNIEGKDKITITITKKDTKEEYTINLNRISKEKNIQKEENKNTDTNIIPYIITFIGIIVIVIITIVIINKIKRNKGEIDYAKQ